MTTTPKLQTLTITRNGSYPEIIDGKLAEIIEALLDPRFKKKIRAADDKMKITIDCKGSSITPSVTLY